MLGAPVFRTALYGPWSGNALWTAARAVPSLDLCFADKKDLICASSGRQLISFARASSGTYTDSAGVLQTAATDVPRFDHNPLTGESLGLLVEEQRTNLVLRSEEFDNASWVKASSTVTANTGSAPDGATTANTFTRTTTGPNYVTQNFTKAASVIQYTYSVFAKQSVGNFCAIRLQGTYPSRVDVVFNLSSATISTAATVFGSFTGPSASITPYANGWYRLTVTGTSDATVGLAIHASFNSNGAVIDGNDSVSTSAGLLWGAQLEAGAFATSYTPTTTAAATRNADVAQITGTNFSSWYRQDEGTVFIETQLPSVATVAAGRTALSISNGTFDERIRITASSTASPFADAIVVRSSATSQASFSTTGSAVGTTPRRIALAVKADDFAAAATGSISVVSDNSGAMPTGQTTLTIGADVSSTSHLSGTIRRLTYWPQRLDNATLQAITQP